MAEGTIVHSMFHGGEDFGFPIKIEERHNLFDMMGDIDLGAGHSLKIGFCCIAQSDKGVAVLEESGIRFRLKESFAVRWVLHDLVVFPGPLMMCYELFFVIDGDELIIGLKGKSA